MVVVAGTARLQPGTGARAQQVIEEVVAKTRQEPGCYSYTFYIEVGDPNTLHVFEEWESNEALDAHIQREHTQRFLAALGELVAAPPDVNKYEISAVSRLL